MKTPKDMNLTLRLALARLESESKKHEPKSNAAMAFTRRPAPMNASLLRGYTTRLKNHLHQQMKHPLAQRIASLEPLIKEELTEDTLDAIARGLEFTGRRMRFDVFGK